jgi:pyruvate,water dikinase
VAIADAGAAATGAFPIRWDDPEHAKLTWFQDVMHNPLPVTPLNATLFQPAFAEGVSRSFARLMLPASGIRVSIQNGYVYLCTPPFSDDPAAMEARMGDMQRVTMEVGPTVLKDWRETFEPQVKERARKVLDFDYEPATAASIAAFIRDDVRTWLVDVWDIHMPVNIPPMNAVFGMEEMLGTVLDEEAVRRSRLLLQGYDNKSVETGRTLWALSRWVRSIDDLAPAVLESRVRGGVIELEEHPQRKEFLSRMQAFLEEYGWRSDSFFEIGHKSWHEDPSTPLTQLKGYIVQEDSQDPFAGHARHAEQREPLAAEIEASLPEAMRPMFRGVLPLAQQYIPIAEDHNFAIDQGFTAVVRHAVLWLGRKLAADGAIGDAEDVFFLTLDEIRRVADGDTSGLDAAARQRRREYAKQAGLRAPLLIGTPPPPDEPLPPVISKFFGVGLAPSDDARVVTGHPCSPGVVTGVAKVVQTLDEAEKLNPGDVLVCRMTMPAWTPLFGVAAAVVADSGGPLSHCAIVAREYGIPCVAGTVNGTTSLKDGLRVRVDGNAGVVTVLTEKTRG